MKKVFLHGALATHLGFSELELDVRTVGEAVRAIEANTRALYKYLVDKANEGIKYRILLGGVDHEKDEDLTRELHEKEIHIVPVPEGEKAVARIIVGAVLMVVGYFALGSTWALAAKIMLNAGVGLVIGGIAELIIGTPKISQEDENQSYLFNNQVNTTKQGGPVPLLYGEIISGSQLINFNIYSNKKTTYRTEAGYYGMGNYRPGYWLNFGNHFMQNDLRIIYIMGPGGVLTPITIHGSSSYWAIDPTKDPWTGETVEVD